MFISAMRDSDIEELRGRIKTDLLGAADLENASQRFVKGLYEYFVDSVVLVRVFVTLKLSEVPENVRVFVENLADGANIRLAPDTHVLTLFGSAGVRQEWNDRRASTGHLGIPLATADFVTAIPMMSAMLEEIGFDLGWIRGEPDIVAHKLQGIGGTFYVDEAATAKDSHGRLIISAQDFVGRYGIRTVFGTGGGFFGTDKFMTMICFLREHITLEQAMTFQLVSTTFKREVFGFVQTR